MGIGMLEEQTLDVLVEAVTAVAVVHADIALGRVLVGVHD